MFLLSLSCDGQMITTFEDSEKSDNKLHLQVLMLHQFPAVGIYASKWTTASQSECSPIAKN